MGNRLLYSINHRVVVMHHVPPSIVKLKDISDMECPAHIKVCFHGNPGHVCQHSSPNISHLKVQNVLPTKGKLPALHYSIVPAEGKKQLSFSLKSKGTIKRTTYSHDIVPYRLISRTFKAKTLHGLHNFTISMWSYGEEQQLHTQ